MFSVKNLLYFAVAVSCAAINRDAADGSLDSLTRRDEPEAKSNSNQTTTDLEDITNNVYGLYQVVSMYNGSPISQYPIVGSQDKLLHSINEATAHGKLAPVASQEDSTAILTYIQTVMWPAMLRAITPLKSKKDLFSQAGQAPAMKTLLVDLKTAVMELSDALVAATPLTKIILALSITRDMRNGFDDVIKAFSS
ncbi:hypothetical protein E4U48_005135 [Claviceps purpurea]|nr:hypothetical protein E4U28_007382 [Claviceps purpurea]KAG6150442.1 hypothetical protein E4U37_006122 [Claviceps purpurea]KAG6163767.1 hypothetical protein E4U51_005523 [Claviceps purpurea]KAG6267293.1 hypothetical protein E4U48_005135 [Claviceps purpurea]